MTENGTPKRLAIGCGHNVREGWTNLDLVALPGVDVVHDLDQIPMPFDDGTFDFIECMDILEHVREFPDVMRELHRITADGGKLHITGPHFTSFAGATDPTHRRTFAINTFEFFSSAGFLDRGYYFDFAFAEVEVRLLRFQKVWYQPWNWVVEPLVNLHRRLQAFFEATFLARLFPAHAIEVVLRK